MARTARIVVVAVLGALVLSFVCTTRIRAAGPTVGVHIQLYGEIDVRRLPPTPPGRAARPIPFHPIDAALFQRSKGHAQLPLGSPSPSTTSTSSVTISNAGFDGVDFNAAGQVIPPDTQVAAGPGHIFEVVNDHVRIWSRQTGSDVYDSDLGAFFGVSFFTSLTDVVSDPRVIYDAPTGRWFVSCVTLETLLGQADWRLAVSKTGDPTGSYALYAASFTNGTFPDFPSLGVNDDKVVLTGNAFTMSSQVFQGSEFLVARKADVVSGVSSPTDTFFGPPQAVDSIQAARSLSSTSTLYLAAISGNGGTSTLEVWSLNGVPGVGSGVSVTAQALTMQTTTVIPPDAVQPNSNVTIATNDTRLLNLSYRDGRLWMGSNTGCTPAGDTTVRSCLHYVQVATATPAITQELTFGDTDTYYYYPDVEIDSSENMVTVFNRSSSAEFASLYASAQGAGDAANTLRSPTLVQSGLAAYDPSPNSPRWGDYSGGAVDPADSGASVWIAGEYPRANGGADWGTWIAKITIGAQTCASAPGAPSGLTPTAGNGQVTLAWSATSGATSYNVKRATTNGGPYTVIASVATTGYTDTGLTNGTPYYYVVSAVNACGESAISSQVTATPTAPPPAAPTRLSATASKSKIMLSWTQSTSAGVTQNGIYRSTTSGGPYSMLATIAATTSYTDRAVTSGTTYYYVVTAISGSGTSGNSNQASAKAK